MDEVNDGRADEDLMALYQGGEYAAFECLYRRHSGRVLEYLKKRIVPAVAQDLVQETFMKMHKSRHQYQAQYPFLPWLFTITKSVLLDHYKLAETKVAQASTASDRVLAGLASGEALASGHDLVSILGSLPLQQRRAIEMRYLNDWSFEKIALELKTSPENTRQIVSRGIKRLRSLFQGGLR